jgi:hypothetical protein
MALLKRRPRIRLYLPSTLLPGSSFTASVVLDARRPVAIEWLDVELEGRCRAAIPVGKSTAMAERRLVGLRARLSSAREIPVGQTCLDCRFAIPEHVPPSYRGVCATVSYTVTVHASIAWWPDAVKGFELVVRTPPETGERARSPALFSSAPEGPQGKEPHAEVSLADSSALVGGTLSGAVALRNVAFARYAGLELALVLIERASAGRERSTREIARFPYQLQLAEAREAEPIPFQLRVPADAPPTTRYELFQLDWVLEVRARRRFGFDLTFSVPLEIHRSGQGEAAPRERAAPPALGSDRARAIWQSVAESEGYTLEDEELGREVEDIRVRVFREHRGAKGIFLVAELVYPSLELGLDGGHVTGFRRVFGDHSVKIGNERWDSAHYLAGRHRVQVEAFARIVGPALAGLSVADLEDSKLRIERAGAGLSAAPLRELSRSALAVARGILALRPLVPPPPGFELSSWQALALQLNGRLETARMVVTGELDGEPIEIATHWSEAIALETRVEIRPRQPLDSRFFEALSLGEGGRVVSQSTGAPPASLPRDVARLAEKLLGQARAVEIRADALCLSLEAPLVDTGPIRDLLPQLANLLERVRVGRSAYR